MERYSIQTFTSAWARYYAASVKGSWIPNMGTWLRGEWHPSTNALVAGAIINPSPMFILVQERTREVALSVEIHYKTALISSWVQETRNGFREDFPVYAFDEDRVCMVVVPAYTDPETIYILPDNNMYQIDSVVVTGGAGRDQEKFSILALASPSPRILYGLGANDLEQNLLRVKRGLFPQPEFCMTCMGTKEYPAGTTCPECGGYGFAGPNAMYPLLDFHGRNVELPRYTSEEDEPYGRRIWARKWNVIPTKSEIERYFMHFMHIMDPMDLFVWERPDDDEPVFWVAAYYGGLGTRALWHQGDANQGYDGMVERVCPAGVNGYFAWLAHGAGVDGDIDDGSGDELVITDESSSQEWDLEGDVYGPLWQGSEWNEALWEEFGDWSSENELDLGAFSGGAAEIIDETFEAWSDGQNPDHDVNPGGETYMLWQVDAESSAAHFTVEQETLGGVASKWGYFYQLSTNDKYLHVWGEFKTPSPQIPAAQDYKVAFDLYVTSTRANVQFNEGAAGTYPPTNPRVQVWASNGGNWCVSNAGTTVKWGGNPLAWSLNTLYHCVVWFISASQYKLSVDGGSTWSDATTNFGGDWGAVIKSMYIYGAGSFTQQFYADNISASWNYVAQVLDAATGTFPVISDTDFDGHVVTFEVTVPDDTADPLEVQITEDGKTATADVRVRVVFDPSDHLVYVLNSGGTPVSTGLTWTQDVEETWAICTVSSTQVRIGKFGDYWDWTGVMACRNTWTAGIKYFIAVTDDAAHVTFGDVTYSW